MMKMHQLWKNAALALSMMLLSVGAYAQHDIKGTVLDESQLPIPGANVVIKGTTIGTVTAGNGEFTMKANDGDVLLVSYMGYTTEEITVSGNGPYNVNLVPDMVGLSEVVVVGYGVQKKSNVTGAIASVKSEDLQHRSSPDAIQAMQGKAAGVTVLNSSGAPGAGGEIRVRGYSSNSDKIGPLYIVDGLKVDNIQYLDPEMIESMEILKDAASAAIYGAQAGNGVILITTKGGGKGDGNIFYNFQYSMNKIGQRAKMMNAEQYIQWNLEAGNFTEADLEKWGYNGEDTDWADVIFGTGITQRHTIGAQGGNDKGSFYAAITNLDNNGIVKGNKDVYKRLSAQINADYKIKKWFSISSNNSIEKWSKKSLGEHNEYAAGGSVFMSTTVMDPITPVYYENAEDIPTNGLNAVSKALTNTHDVYNEVIIGDKTYYEKVSQTDTLATYQTLYGDENGYYAVSKVFEGDAINPLITRDKASGKEEGFNFRGSLSADLKPIKGLVFTSRLGYVISQKTSNNLSVPYYANDKNANGNYSMSASADNNWYYQWENFANYNLTLGANDLGVMVGTSFTENNTFNVGGKLDGSDILSSYEKNFQYISYAKQDANTCTKDITGGKPNQERNISYFGRLSWSYANRYNLQVNFRADAFDSSKLSKENRWGKFPSVSAGWTLSNEDFLKDALGAATISYLKIRASWGQNGNVAVLRDYPYSVDVSLNSQPYQFEVTSPIASYGSFPNGLANPDLKWETSEQIDLGLDGRLLNDKLSFAVDYYHKKTKDLLIPVTPVLEIGVTSTTINAGEIVNQGLEFELGWKDKIGDFSYSLNANAATLKNEVTYLDPSVDRILGAKFADHLLQTCFEEGHSVWYMRGYEYAGVDDAGKALFVDRNGELTNKPVADDMKDLGQGIPKFTYGLTINMEYKGFDFTVFGTGVAGNKIYACNYRTQHSKINGMELFYEGRSTIGEDGKVIVGKYPLAREMKSNTDFYSSSANLFNGSYFKIKQIQLGYTVPKELTSKLAISDFRVYVSVDDYFTFTKYEGFDPEVASNGTANSIGFDKGSYPPSKKITFGLNLTF